MQMGRPRPTPLTDDEKSSHPIFHGVAFGFLLIVLAATFVMFVRGGL